MQTNLSKILIRGGFLLVLSFWLTLWFSSYITKATVSISSFKEGVSSVILPISVSEALEDISPLVKVPFPLMKFNAYASNEMKDVGNDSATSTNLNIDFLGAYTTIQTGETKLLKEGFTFFHGLTFERSITTLGDDKEGLKDHLEGKFTVFHKMTIASFILVWLIFIIPITYAFIVIFSSIWGFILMGTPFIEIMDKFKGKD